MMGTLIAIFAISIGAATFIENDFGTEAAKAVVYNATWFEILLILITGNLAANIYHYKLYKKEKWSMGLFHVSFIIILIGSELRDILVTKEACIYAKVKPQTKLQVLTIMWALQLKKMDKRMQNQ